MKNDHAEAGTADVRRMLGEAGSESFISRLATVEILRADPPAGFLTTDGTDPTDSSDRPRSG